MTVRGLPRDRFMGNEEARSSVLLAGQGRASRANTSVRTDETESKRPEQTQMLRRSRSGPQRGRAHMTATAPIGTLPPQHMRALARANEVRLARAELKRKVADEDVEVADVILDCP